MELQARTLRLKNGKEVTIRSARAEDAAELHEAARTIIAVSDHLLTQIDEFTVTVEKQRDRIASFEAGAFDLLIVPLIDGKIVGMLDFRAGARKRNSHWGDFGISVLPNLQGQGVGKALLATLIEWARSHSSIEQLRLKVHSRNTGAVALYKKMGFKEEGRELRGVKIADGVYDDVICMVNELI